MRHQVENARKTQVKFTQAKNLNSNLKPKLSLHVQNPAQQRKMSLWKYFLLTLKLLFCLMLPFALGVLLHNSTFPCSIHSRRYYWQGEWESGNSEREKIKLLWLAGEKP